MAQKHKTGYFKNLLDQVAKDKRANSDSVAYREGFMIIGPLAILGAVVCAIGGAVALPLMYATNFGAALTMGLTGLVTGGVVGGATPLALHKIAHSAPWGFLKPGCYVKAWKANRAAKAAQAAAGQNTPKKKTGKKAAKPASSTATPATKLAETSSPKTALNAAANDKGAPNKKAPEKTAAAQKKPAQKKP